MKEIESSQKLFGFPVVFQEGISPDEIVFGDFQEAIEVRIGPMWRIGDALFAGVFDSRIVRTSMLRIVEI